MKRFYKATITKQPIGSAVRHKEPAVQGKVIVKVTDSTTAGDYKLLFIDCDDAQNKTNLTIPGVEELSEEQALELAAQYQPKRTLTQLNTVTMEEEEIDVPACDLRNFYKK